MPACAVTTCNKRSGTSSLEKDGVAFHFFPKDPEIKKIWTASCSKQENWMPTHTSCICSRHFDASQYRTLPSKRRKLIDFAVPTLFLCEKNNIPRSINKSLVQVNKVEIKVDIIPPNTESCPSTSKEYQQPTAPNSTLELTCRKRKLTKKVEAQVKKIKRLQAKTRYLKTKVASLEDLSKKLDEKSLIDKEQKHILQKIGVKSAELLKRQLKNSETGKLSREKYSPELRCFALTLHYYSPKAYRYVRKTFGTSLPHPRTITKWYANIDGRPGFTQEALNALKLLREENKNKMFCSLIIDEMKIKEFPYFDPKTQRYFGHVNYGFEEGGEGSPSATDALVFLLVGINTSWKLPIGYFLTKGTSAKLRAQLVTTALQLVHNTRVEIKALTCDGTRTNISMAEELGCNLNPDSEDLQTTFLDPLTGQKVHFFLDPCHMLKLVRNSLEFYKYFYDSSGNSINWNCIMNLHNLQEDELFYLANKLRANHVYFKTKIMNVRLAAQLFSESVADALTFCETKLKMPDFDKATVTADFLKLVNDVFDILDSKTCGFGFKKAMNSKNYEKCFQRLDEATFVIRNLSADVINRKKQVERMSVLKSPRYTGFLGFLICVSSAKAMYHDLVTTPDTGMNYLPLHKISQDHIEILFSNVRSHGGFSDNPTAFQLESIYKKLLVHKELIANESGANCVPLENINILNCSSAIEKINVTSVNARENSLERKQDELEEDSFELECQIYLSPFGEKVVEYIAGFVTFALAKKIKCDYCVKGLFGACKDQSFIYPKTKGYLAYASEFVILLCQQCEKVIRQGLDEKKRINSKYTTSYVTLKSLLYFIGKDLFPNIQDHDSDVYVNHKVELAKSVMEKYTNVQLCYLSKKSDPKNCIRHIYNKLVHLKNQ